ncbi:MAG: hypothetical protein JWR63_3693 [Conexibacter sp.]|nr:hypothetical protein [Conexibacter sp.]
MTSPSPPPSGRARLGALADTARSRAAAALRARLAVDQPSPDLLAALGEYAPPLYPDLPGPVTNAILARMAPGDHEAVLAAASEEWRRYYELATDAEKPHLLLNFAAHWHVEPTLGRLGLSSAQPPDDVHAMARGPRAAAGASWFADLVVDAAERAGAGLSPGARVLDFGCSSGRVLRVLAAWRDDIEWHGCDPNAEAVAWADANITGLSAFASAQEPPLPLEDASFDLVFAISVWSHFGATQAVRWISEMERVIKPGGALVMTTQGFASLAYYFRENRISDDDARDGGYALVAHGHKYFEAFGDDGDWGVSHPEWGMAYLTTDWLAGHVLDRWSLAVFNPGRIDSNQDLVVLVRREPGAPAARDTLEP